MDTMRNGDDVVPDQCLTASFDLIRNVLRHFDRSDTSTCTPKTTVCRNNIFPYPPTRSDLDLIIWNSLIAAIHMNSVNVIT